MTIGMRLPFNILGKLGLAITNFFGKSKYNYEKNTKKNERSWSRLLEGPHPFGNGNEQCAILWGCIPKVASMSRATDNGIQVPYT